MPLDEQNKQLKRELIVIPIDKTPVETHLRKIGPLKLAPEEEKDK